MLKKMWKYIWQTHVDAKKVSLKGKTVVVTGSNTGIGYTTARGFVKWGAKVIMGCRTKEKATHAMKQIKEEVKDADLGFIPLDLSDLDSIDSFVEKLKDEKIDIFVHNAGLVDKSYGEKETAKKGEYELMFLVNTIGTYNLTKKIVPFMKKRSRIVVVSAGSHEFIGQGHMEGSNLEDFTQYPVPAPWWNIVGAPFYQYSVSKLFMIWITYSMAPKLLKENGISINVLHPGIIQTEFGQKRDSKATLLKKDVESQKQFLMKLTWEQGAQTTLHVSTAPNLGTGKYFENCEEIRSSDFSYDKKYQKKVVKMCDEIIEKLKDKKKEKNEQLEEIEVELH